MPTRILVKTTIGPVMDDWHVGRFSLLTDHLRSLRDSSGGVLYDVAARDRSVNQEGEDTDLVQLAHGAHEQAAQGRYPRPLDSRCGHARQHRTGRRQMSP